MKFNKAYPILKLFIDKAKKLEDSSFLKSIQTDFRLDFKIEINKPMEIKSIRPQQESIDAFILTFRFFVQDKDNISLRKLKEIFDSTLVLESEREKFNSLRTELNYFLSEPAQVQIKADKPTNREVMDTILYGELSHSDEEKKKRYDSWMDTMEIMQEAIWHRFIISIIKVTSTIQRIKCLLCVIISRNLAITSSMILINYGNVKYSYSSGKYCENFQPKLNKA